MSALVVGPGTLSGVDIGTLIDATGHVKVERPVADVRRRRPAPEGFCPPERPCHAQELTPQVMHSPAVLRWARTRHGSAEVPPRSSRGSGPKIFLVSGWNWNERWYVLSHSSEQTSKKPD